MREESWTTLLLNTFTVLLKRRREKERLLLVLLVISFVLFEMTFPVDDNLLYIHFKDKFKHSENPIPKKITQTKKKWVVSTTILQINSVVALLNCTFRCQKQSDNLLQI